MKRLVVSLMFLMVVTFLAAIVPSAFAFEFDKTPHRYEFDKTPLRYDAEDIKFYKNVLSLVREGKLEEAEKVVLEIKDYELRWMGYYLIAMDGYASQGKTDKAVELVGEIKRLMDELVVIPGEDIFEGVRQKFLGHVIISAVESGHWQESLRIFPLLSRPFYYFQGVENAVLRLPNKTAVEEFLSHLKYRLFYGKSRRVVYKNSHYLMVVYGQKDKVLQVFHWFSPRDLRKLIESQ